MTTPLQAALLAEINRGCVDAIRLGCDISVVTERAIYVLVLASRKAPLSWECRPGSLSSCGFQIAQAKISRRIGMSSMHHRIKEKSSAIVDPNRLGLEQSTKSEYVQPTKERREQGGGAQEEKSNLLDKIVGCIRICL